jgi:predicted Zn-dependent protease
MPFQLVAMLLLAQAAAPANPPRFEELTEQVDKAVREHRNLDAVGMLDKALKENPKWQQGWWLLGSILYDMNDYPAARPVQERLVQMDPKSGAPWVLLGLCEFEMQDYGLALQHLQRGDAFGFPPELDLLEVARFHEALLLILAEKFEPAQVLLDQLIRKGKDTDEVTLAEGLAALRIPMLPATLPQAAGEDRMELVRRVGQAQRAIARDRMREAVEMYKELTARNPRVANLHLSYAALLSQLRNRPAAEAELREELKVNPRSVAARLKLCTLLEDDSPAEAARLAEEAVRLDPKSFKAHFSLGRLLLKMDKPAESAKELEISRDLAPSSSMVRFELIKAYMALGKTDDADRETKMFKRLRAAEEQFRKSGQVPASYFEPDAPGAAPAPKAH